jgi:hypothetical protein
MRSILGSPRRLAVLGAASVLVTLAGCSGFNDARGIGDAPVGPTFEKPRKVWVNIDQFPNVVAFCIGANGVYTTTREAAPTVVPDDPNCAEGGILRD